MAVISLIPYFCWPTFFCSSPLVRSSVESVVFYQSCLRPFCCCRCRYCDCLCVSSSAHARSCFLFATPPNGALFSFTPQQWIFVLLADLGVQCARISSSVLTFAVAFCYFLSSCRRSRAAIFGFHTYYAQFSSFVAERQYDNGGSVRRLGNRAKLSVSDTAFSLLRAQRAQRPAHRVYMQKEFRALYIFISFYLFWGLRVFIKWAA